MANKDTAKPWFKTFAYPTQSQFWQVFDWLRWNDQPLEISDVDLLAQTLNDLSQQISTASNPVIAFTLNVNGTFDLAAGAIVTAIIVESATDITLQIGTVFNGNDVAADVAIAAGVPGKLMVLVYKATAQTLYFTGITGTTKITLIKNSL